MEKRLEDIGDQPAECLDRVAAEWPADAALLRHLVRFAEGADPRPQAAATGLLKRYLAAGVHFPEPLAATLIELLPVVVHWEARLHLLQILPALLISPARAANLYEFLQRSLVHERNCFVRAWIFSGLHRLAALHPGYRREISVQLERAAREEPASVRARLRRLPALGER